MLLSLLLLACTTDKGADTAGAGDTDTPPAYDWQALDVTEAGPFNVGHTTVLHTYTAFDGDDPRIIAINVWYPTTDTEGEPSTYITFAVQGDGPTLENVVEVEQDDVFKDASSARPIHDGGYPVLAYSHGDQAHGADAAHLMRHAASHGWVAVAPSHTGNFIGQSYTTRHYIHKALDIQESLDILSEVGLIGAVATAQVVLSGHSFGASYTTWAGAGAGFDAIAESCKDGSGLPEPCTDDELAVFTSGTLADDRVAAIIPLDGSIRGALFGDTGYRAVEEPVLMLSGTGTGGCGGCGDAYDAMPELTMTWVALQEACHLTFTNGVCSGFDTDLGFTITDSYSLAFGRKHLLGDGTYDDLLDGTEQPWSEVTVQAR